MGDGLGEEDGLGDGDGIGDGEGSGEGDGFWVRRWVRGGRWGLGKEMD